MEGDDELLLAARFDEHRPRLRAVAYRMLGSADEADDAVEETWQRLSRAGAEGVDDLAGRLTAVVARVCLDMLRSRESRREEPWEAHLPEPVAGPGSTVDPEHQELLADSAGRALLVVLDTLTPAERLAFVLHDMFAVPFDEIAPVVERTSSATRQLASRARRRVQDAEPVADSDEVARRDVVEAFLAASRAGDSGALLALLAPDVVLRTDAAGAASGPGGASGAEAVARTFTGRAKAARPALINGSHGLVWAPGGRPRVVFGLTVSHGTVVAIDLLSDPEHLARLDLEILGD